MPFLPISTEDARARNHAFSQFDVVFVTGDPYYDHPLSGTALLARLLEKKGYSVGIVAQPVTDAEFMACGRPKYFFCVSTGLLDSMLANYTPMLRKREGVLVPEHGLIAYTQALKRLFPKAMVVIGGVEATIRRCTHFDYKENALRRGVLHDTKADLLLFGNAERSLLTLLECLRAMGSHEPRFADVKERLDLPLLDGAAFLSMDSRGAIALPSYEECVSDKDKFALLTRIMYLLPDRAFHERCGKGAVLHNRPSHPLTENEMDFLYDLPFERKVHPASKQLSFVEDMVSGLVNSVIIGRGCWGSCSFCIIPLVQGKHVARRSKESILREIEVLYLRGEKHINDLTLPTLNMYGSRCDLYDTPETIRSPLIDTDIVVYNKRLGCNQQCVGCEHRKISDDLIPLLESVRALQQKHAGTTLELRSALRHDIVLSQKTLFREVMRFVSRLKIAPEHISDNVLAQMRKADRVAFDEFLQEFDRVNEEQGTKKRLVPYFVAAHPGCTMDDMRILKEYCTEHGIFVNLTQVFTPTPGTLSTAMYFTGKNPLTGKLVHIARTFREKKDQKNALLAGDDDIVDDNG